MKSGQIGSADKIRSHFTKFEQYLGSRKASFYDIDEIVLIEYQAYLKNTLGNSVTTIHTNLKSIRRIFSIAVEKDIIGAASDSIKKIKLKTEKSMIIDLSWIECANQKFSMNRYFNGIHSLSSSKNTMN